MPHISRNKRFVQLVFVTTLRRTSRTECEKILIWIWGLLQQVKKIAELKRSEINMVYCKPCYFSNAKLYIANLGIETSSMLDKIAWLASWVQELSYGIWHAYIIPDYIVSKITVSSESLEMLVVTPWERGLRNECYHAIFAKISHMLILAGLQ